MTAVFSLLVVLTLSFLITRLFTAALVLTGLSKSLARLQAVSAFTGVGFTTAESEHIVGHPVRRRMLIILMILGNAGIVTSIATLLLSFTNVGEAQNWLWRIGFLVLGLVVLWIVVASDWIDRHLHRVMEWALQRWSRMQAMDFADLLDLGGEYRIRELSVDPDDWVAGQCLDELNLFREGITVLGIHRDGRFIGVPRGETEVCAGDRLVLYGREDNMRELDERRRGTEGDEAHRRAVEDQQRHREAQERREQARSSNGAD